MNQFGDDLIAWCKSCRDEATRQFLFDDQGFMSDEKDPICRRCLNTAELISPAALHERNLGEQAEAVAKLLRKQSNETVERSERTKSEPRDPKALLNVEAAAAFLDLSVSTVYKRAGKGSLIAVKDGGRLLFRPTDLDAYVEARRRSPERATEFLASRRKGRETRSRKNDSP